MCMVRITFNWLLLVRISTILIPYYLPNVYISPSLSLQIIASFSLMPYFIFILWWPKRPQIDDRRAHLADYNMWFFSSAVACYDRSCLRVCMRDVKKTRITSFTQTYTKHARHEHKYIRTYHRIIIITSPIKCTRVV